MIIRCLVVLWFCLGIFIAPALEKIPEKLVVLTFDDSVASQYSVVRPILQKYGFGGTFFISEGFSFGTNKRDYMSWEQIRALHDAGFEIGNHTRDHLGVTPATLSQLREQVEAINRRCAEYGIPRPVSFGYPGNAIVPGALPVLKGLGISFARRGGAPEQAYDWGRGTAYEPGNDHPLLIPSAGDARPDWALEDFKKAVEQAHSGRIAVLQFHGVPDREHPWVSTQPERFEEYMRYLKNNSFQVIALRDLKRYVDPEAVPTDPLSIIEKRRAERREVLVEGEIVDDRTGERLPARIYVQDQNGRWYFPRSLAGAGETVRYERSNGANPKAVEKHTTLSREPFRLELLPGRYTFTVERGKEYFPERREITVTNGSSKISFRLKRWVNMAEQGWYSGDTHNHRDPAELPNVMLAEDLNVALPMVDWTTDSTVSPRASTQGFRGEYGNDPVSVDATHVWNPRNSEYEIFRTEKTNHTLGALVILNQATRLNQPVIPLRAVAKQAHQEGALLDLEKHNWPWSMALVPIAKIDLFELANNHHWETEYAVRNWAVPAPRWMGFDGTGTDNERDWTLYGFQTYYSLLNCGFRLRPAAGTANGVHPVPLGFSRVYVHLDQPFTFEAWMRGLSAGRSFVTTGPMLFAKVAGEWPGKNFESAGGREYPVACSVVSEQPLESVDLIVNGAVFRSFTPENRQLSSGAFETKVAAVFSPRGSSWLAWRCFEKRPNDRFRFAHTAPWHFTVPGEPLRPRRDEAEWLVSRVEEEIARSRGVVPAALLEEYQSALETYQRIAKNSH